MPAINFAHFKLTKEDLSGHSFEDVECQQCSVACHSGQPVFYGGHPAVICCRQETGREVARRWKERTKVN